LRPVPVKATVQSIDQLWNISYNTELRYFSWRNTQGFPIGVTPLNGNGNGRGSQFYAPMSLSVTGTPDPNWKLEFVARGGFVSASQTTPGERGSVDTAVDTQLSGTVTYNGFNGFQPFAALLINAPTGRSALYGTSRFSRMDGDLVDIGSYGEGWNFGPSAGVSIPLSQQLLLTLSGGYTARGAFDKEAANPITGLITATDRIKNGDEATVNATLGYAVGAFSAQGSGSYAWSTVSQTNGFDQYRSGPRVTVSGNASYAFNAFWSVYTNGFWTHTSNNDVRAGGLVLIQEMLDSNSNLYRVNTGLNYRFTNGVTVGPTASYLYRDRNGYDPIAFQFVPAKTRYAVGGAASYNVTNKISINGKLERIWIRENENLGPPPATIFFPTVPFLSGDGWAVAAGATVTF
jgi:hypothetical protein